MDEIKAKKALDRIRRKGVGALVLRSPFFGTLALEPKLVADESIPTCCVSPEDEIRFNPEFVLGLSDKLVMSAVAHEVLHLAFDVFGRCGARNQTKWNLADDYANNSILKESGLALGEDWLYEAGWHLWASERIYDAIPDPPKPHGEDGVEEGEEQDKPGLGRPRGCAKHGPKTPASAAKQEARAQAWKSKIAQAAAAARACGSMPAGLEKIVEKLLRPRLPWRKILERFLADASSISDDQTLSVPGRRQPALGWPVPSDLPKPEPVALFFDTSGSMGDEVIRRCVNEAAAILRLFPGTPVRVLCGDAELTGDFNASQADEVASRLKGGGGTDFRPIFERLIKDRVRPRALVGFSDLAATYPERVPPFPVLWATPAESGIKPPFGRVVVMKDD